MTNPSTRMDAVRRRHPALMLIAAVSLAVLATLLLLSRTEGTIVLYQAF